MRMERKEEKEKRKEGSRRRGKEREEVHTSQVLCILHWHQPS
jgi:hypothetical protein